LEKDHYNGHCKEHTTHRQRVQLEKRRNAMNDYLNNYGRNYFRQGKNVKNLEYLEDEKINSIVELIPTKQRSYYGKARIITTDNSVYLLSYDTIVCGMVNNNFVRYWDSYSVTTMNHINDFLKYLGFGCACVGGKKWWNSLECNTEYSVSDILNICAK
jgi:hypothetical protein